MGRRGIVGKGGEKGTRAAAIAIQRRAKGVDEVMRRRALSLAALAAAATMLAAPGTAAATPGDLDPTFSTDGLSEFAIGGSAVPGYIFRGPSVSPIGFEPDGDLILAGSTRYEADCSHLGCFLGRTLLAMARVQPDGELDPGFGSGGVLETDLGLAGNQVGPGGAAVAPDGRIVVVVAAGENAIIARLLPDGSLDPSFGGDGFVRPDIPGSEWVTSVAVQADGRILLGGRIDGKQLGTYLYDQDFLLVRLREDGSLDPSFSDDGEQIVKHSLTDNAERIVLDGQGRIVVAGDASVQLPFSENVSLLRLRPDGSPDQGFSGDGYAELDLLPDERSNDYVLDLAVDSRDRPVLLANASREHAARGTLGTSTAIVRFTAAGELDPSLSTGGVHYLEGVPEYAIGTLTTTADDGLIVAGGFGRELMVGRRLSDGDPDPGFGTDGWAEEYPLTGGGISDVLSTPDGRIVLGGTTFEFPTRVLMARMRVDANPPDDADADGIHDPGDRCPGAYEPAGGCPDYDATVGLKREKRALGLRLKAGHYYCFASRLELYRKRKGPDRRLSRRVIDDSALHSYAVSPAALRYAIKRPRRGGRVYARVRPRFDPTVGKCHGARSHSVRLAPVADHADDAR